MFSCICRTTGLYTKTLAKIIRQDVTRFMTVFAVVFLSFCGSLFLSLRSSKQSQQFRCVLLMRLWKLPLIQLDDRVQSLSSLKDDWDWTQKIPCWWRSLAGLLRAREHVKPSKSASKTLQMLSYIFIFSGFEDVLLSGFRALSEQQPFAEDYSSFK